MKASQAAVELIKSFESLELEAYLCPAQVWTIGWGHTDGVHTGMRITKEEAEAFLARDISRVEADLPSVIHAPLTQGQYDALVSLCFNLKGGPHGLSRIAPRLVGKINSGDHATAATEFLDINRANGKVLAGLARRRRAEQALFLA
jgi:lysozyme